MIYKNLEIFRKHGKIKYYQGKLKKERDMRKYSRLVIALSHEGDENSVFSAPVVEMKNGDSSVQVADFESALHMLPPGSEVCVVARGTVGDMIIQNISRIIRESGIFIELDLSEVKELSRVLNSPFKGNVNLTSIKFPCNLASLNESAFAGCKNLRSVVVPASVKKIGSSVFYGCENLTYLEFQKMDGWSAIYENCERILVTNLEDPEDNPFRFSLPSSPYRNCVLQRD